MKRYRRLLVPPTVRPSIIKKIEKILTEKKKKNNI